MNDRNTCTPSSSTTCGDLPECPSSVLTRSVQLHDKVILVAFQNEHRKPLDLVWVNLTGGEAVLGTILVGKTIHKKSYPGHVWRLREAMDPTRLVFETKLSHELSYISIPECNFPEDVNTSPHFPHGIYPLFSQLVVITLIWYLKCFKKRENKRLEEKTGEYEN